MNPEMSDIAIAKTKEVLSYAFKPICRGSERFQFKYAVFGVGFGGVVGFMTTMSTLGIPLYLGSAVAKFFNPDLDTSVIDKEIVPTALRIISYGSAYLGATYFAYRGEEYFDNLKRNGPGPF